jgi:HSP20 family protein
MIAINKTPKSIKEVSDDKNEKKIKFFGSNDNDKVAKKEDEDWFSDYEGQLAVDVYQTPSDVVIKAPIAGVKPEEIEVSIAEDVVTIKGERKSDIEVNKENYYYQECYWGTFSRSVVLPVAADTEHADATFKNGILTIIIPKEAKAKTKKVRVKQVQ